MADNVDITFAGTSIPDAMADAGVEFGVIDIEGEGLLGAEMHSLDRPGSDGDRHIKSKLPARTITVSYSLQVGSEASHTALTERLAVERLLNGLLHRPGLSELEFSHMEGYFMAKVSAAPVSLRYSHLYHGSIEFYCPQPFLYGDETSSTPSGGLVLVNTNYFVEPEIRWTLNDSVGAAWIEVDGHRLTVDTGISEGQQVRIDCARKEVRVGGVLNVENVSGVFPRVRDGSSVITDPGGSLTFNYQERQI